MQPQISIIRFSYYDTDRRAVCLSELILFPNIHHMLT